jgi:hypothetical protein
VEQAGAEAGAQAEGIGCPGISVLNFGKIEEFAWALHRPFTPFDEFLNLPDPPSGHFELHHGQAILVPVRKHQHAEIQQALAELLLPLTRGKGLLKIEFPFRTPAHESGKRTLPSSAGIAEPE